ncbi:MAG: hypothetical protein FJ096_18540 [Deltaproteobacteria bacterium]|nr:hypothetical protein [Deltaproteobacteria bacterium]
MSRTSSEKTYEMLWDCEYCGAKKLLGLTQRFCPTCGGPQNPAKRYFPSDADKVAVEDHPFVGADVTCPSCRHAMGSACNNCSNCGSPIQGGKQVAMHGEQVLGAGGQWQNPAAVGAGPTPAKKSWVPTILLIVVLAIVALIVARATIKKDGEVTVARHEWLRSIAVERLDEVDEKGPCKSVPANARILERGKAEPTCTTKRIDSGDGTFKEKKECTEAVEQCTYKVEKWKTATTAKETGGLDREPVWPTPAMKLCTTRGCERAGEKTETYTVFFKDTAGKDHSCALSDLAGWKGYAKGAKYGGKIRVVGGDLDCDSLTKK